MPEYWISLHDRPAAVDTPPEPSGRAGEHVVDALLGSLWSGWIAEPDAACEVALRALGVGPATRVLHPIAPPPWLDRALAAAGCERIEVDVSALTASPVWPAVGGETVVLDHRHSLPQVPPGSAACLIEDATTAIGGGALGRRVGTLGDLAVMALGPPLCPRSTGALVTTPHRRWAGVLGHESAVRRLGDVVDPGVCADLRALPERIQGFQAAAQVYDSAWRGKGLPLHVVAPTPVATSPRSEYLIRVHDPAALEAALAAEGVETRRPLNERLRRLLAHPDEPCAGARDFYGHVLQLPNHPGLDLGEILFVADVVIRHLRAAHT